MTVIQSKFFWLFLILIMSAYVLFAHATACEAAGPDIQVERHQRMLSGQSEFFNPWQYRIFSAFLLEGFIRIFPTDPQILPYFFLHYIQLVLIFYLSIYYYKKLGIENPFLLGIGLLVLCYAMANSTFRSDLSFNTYFDVAFYLLAAILILGEKYVWVIPLTFFAALNRETSGFIPLMLLFPWSERYRRGVRTKWIIAGVSLIVFFAALIAVRGYYGYRPAVGIHGMTSPLDYFVFNVTFVRLYPLFLGTLGILPFLMVFCLRSLPPVLRSWFWLIIPLWFIIHFLKSTVMETRLFLVPQALIFLPAVLLLIEKWYRDHFQVSTEK